MIEDPTNITQVDPQAGDTASDPQPQAGEETTTTEPQAGESQQPEAISFEEAKKLRSEAANLRKRLKEAELLKNELGDLKKFKEQIETEKLSETEKQTAARQKLEKQLSDLQAELYSKETEIQEQKINNDIFSKAAKVGINPNLAAKVLDHSELDFDDKGNPTNVESLLKDLLKEYPNLASTTPRTAPSSGGATNPPRSQTNNAQLSWETIGKMTKEQYDNRRSEITQWMASNMPR